MICYCLLNQVATINLFLYIYKKYSYPCQNANIVLPPSPAAPDAKFGFVVMEQNKVHIPTIVVLSLCIF